MMRNSAPYRVTVKIWIAWKITSMEGKELNE